jgi:hypothetical protein
MGAPAIFSVSRQYPSCDVATSWHHRFARSSGGLSRWLLPRSIVVVLCGVVAAGPAQAA